MAVLLGPAPSPRRCQFWKLSAAPWWGRPGRGLQRGRAALGLPDPPQDQRKDGAPLPSFPGPSRRCIPGAKPNQGSPASGAPLQAPFFSVNGEDGKYNGCFRVQQISLGTRKCFELDRVVAAQHCEALSATELLTLMVNFMLRVFHLMKKRSFRTSLVVQWLGIQASTAGA